MAFEATVIQVMIASPSDVPDERSTISEVLQSWNNAHAKDREIVLMPTSWETHSTPEMSGRPQAIINRQVLDQCDVLIGVFWSRIGTHTGVAVSGTAEEIDRHIAAGKPVMLYFSTKAIPHNVDIPQLSEMRVFKDKCSKVGLVETFASIEELRNKLTNQLAIKMNSDEYLKQIYETKDEIDDVVTLSTDALLLLRDSEANGHIWKAENSGGCWINVAGKQYIEEGNVRSLARWKAAFKELWMNDFIEEEDYPYFRITHVGYQFLDRLKNEKI